MTPSSILFKEVFLGLRFITLYTIRSSLPSYIALRNGSIISKELIESKFG